MSWSMKSINEAVWSLHFWCIFASWSSVNNYLASCSALAIVFAQSQNQVDGRFWVAGRNAQVRWGEIWGGFVICRLGLADWTLALDMTRRAMPTARAADSIAPRIPPGLAIGNGNYDIGNRTWLRICIKNASFKLLLLCFSWFNSLFASHVFKNVVPARAGTTLLQNDFKRF